MSNPTTMVAPLAGSLSVTTPSGSSALVGVDPIRYTNGLWLEQAATNEFYDPRNRNTGSWIATGGTVTYVGSPDYYHEISSATNDAGGRTSQSYVANPMPGIAGAWVFSCDIEYVSGATDWKITAFEFDTGGSVVVNNAQVANITILPGTNRYVGVYTPSNGATTRVSFSLRRRTAVAGVIRVRKTNIVSGAVLTSSVDGSAGSGYSWSSTADNSPSTRAASSASLSPSGILDPASGALAFRATPTIETGLEEIWGECGVKGAGTDHIRWGRDASKHPFVEWSANNASYQRLTGSETLNALTAYDLYLGHTGTVTSLAVDAGTLQTGTRAAVSGDFSTGDLTLEASAGGVIYQPFATFSRTLTAKEIATLNGKNNWTMNVLAGNPYINFQLRPY